MFHLPLAAERPATSSVGSTQTSPPRSLPPVPEQDEWGGGVTNSPSPSNDWDQVSARSLPTEYGRAFRTGLNPRPRNPVHGWQARNISNVIPVTGAEGSVRQRPLRRPPPLDVQRQRSQIFPEALVVVPREGETTTTDVNNNPLEPPPPPPPPARGRRTYPQARGQTSSIFTGGTATTPNTRARSTGPQWPWQERAKKSVIFELLTSKEPPTPAHRLRTYEWNQQKSTTNIWNFGEAAPLNPPSSLPPYGRTFTGKPWPWQERSQQSVIFLAPEKPNLGHQIKYAWDQRRTRFSVQLDPEAKFAKDSHYNRTFPKWQNAQGKSVKPAGKPCYMDEEIGETDTTTKRRSPSKERKKKQPMLALSAPSQRSSVSKVKGATCLEVVPADYNFN